MPELPASADRTQVKSPRIKASYVIIVIVLAVAGVFLSNVYVARHQMLFIASGLSSSVTVAIPDQLTLEVPAAGLRQVVIPEGDYVATVSGATNQTIEFSIHRSFFSRWTDQHAFILNVAGSAILVEEETYYASREEAEKQTEPPPVSFQLHYGESFLVVSNVDYFFEAFPDQVNADTRQGRVVRRRVDITREAVGQLCFRLAQEDNVSEALSLAEWHLQAHPEDTDLLPTYLGLARLAKEVSRAGAFLARGRTASPVNIPWHRMYQETMHESAAAVTEEYESFLASDPNDSAWLYLRGRLAATCEDAASYYTRAVASDPNNAFAQFALGTVRSSQKRWEDAKSALSIATQLNPEDLQFQDSLFDVRMALGEYEALTVELQGRLLEDPLSYQSNIRLADVYAAQKLDQPLRDLLMRFARGVHEKYQMSGMEGVVNLDARVAYSIGNFSEIESLAQTVGRMFPSYVLFQAYIEQGKFEDAFAISPLSDSRIEEPLHYVAVGLALTLADRIEESQAWIDRAIELLRVSRPEYKRVGEILAETQAPDPSTVLELVLTPSAKALICACLGWKFPGIRSAMLVEADDFNISRDYPFHLIERAVRAGKKD